MLVATVLHGAFNGFGNIISTAVSPADGVWFVLASAVIMIAVLMVMDRGMWFAQPAQTIVNEAVPADVRLTQ